MDIWKDAYINAYDNDDNCDDEDDKCNSNDGDDDGADDNNETNLVVLDDDEHDDDDDNVAIAIIPVQSQVDACTKPTVVSVKTTAAASTRTTATSIARKLCILNVTHNRNTKTPKFVYVLQRYFKMYVFTPYTMSNSFCLYVSVYVGMLHENASF